MKTISYARLVLLICALGPIPQISPKIYANSPTCQALMVALSNGLHPVNAKNILFVTQLVDPKSRLVLDDSSFYYVVLDQAAASDLSRLDAKTWVDSRFLDPKEKEKVLKMARAEAKRNKLEREEWLGGHPILSLFQDDLKILPGIKETGELDVESVENDYRLVPSNLIQGKTAVLPRVETAYVRAHFRARGLITEIISIKNPDQHLSLISDDKGWIYTYSPEKGLQAEFHIPDRIFKETKFKAKNLKIQEILNPGKNGEMRILVSFEESFDNINYPHDSIGRNGFIHRLGIIKLNNLSTSPEFELELNYNEEEFNHLDPITASDEEKTKFKLQHMSNLSKMNRSSLRIGRDHSLVLLDPGTRAFIIDRNSGKIERLLQFADHDSGIVSMNKMSPYKSEENDGIIRILFESFFTSDKRLAVIEIKKRSIEYQVYMPHPRLQGRWIRSDEVGEDP